MLLAQGILLIIAMVVGLIAIALQLAMNIRECMKQDEPEPQEHHVNLVIELKGKGWNTNDSN